MDEILNSLFVEPARKFYDSLIEYFPKILGFLIVFAAGLLLGALLKAVMLRAFRLLHLDSLSERVGMKDILIKGGIREPVSSLISRLVGWVTVFVFFIIALNVLEVPEVGYLLRDFFLYLPNVLAAAAIVFLGYLLSNFLGRAALIACVNADVKASGAVGRFVKLGVFLLATTMALEQLGIGKETIIVSFAIIFGGVVFAFALAFGLGGKDAAKGFIEDRLKMRTDEDKDKKDEIRHI